MKDQQRDSGATRRLPQLEAVSPSVRIEPTRPPPRPRRAREVRQISPAVRVLNGLLTFAAVVMLALGLAGYWFHAEVGKPGPLREARSFVVKRGEGARDIAQRLEAEGVITSQNMFVVHYLARGIAAWFGARPLQLKAGDYDLPAGASMRDIAALLGEGRSTMVRISIPEGLTSHQIVERLNADPNLTGTIAEVPPEGSLLPDTYKYARGMSRQALLDLMRAEATKFLAESWAQRAPGLPLQTPAEAVVLASIVEKETGRGDERPQVAGVFHNRLRQGMRLQSDPTILYGQYGGQVSWGKPIYRSEIQQKTAHNTYQIDGLPPTPICNPGRPALQAVLTPAKTSALYFVADGSGGHIFSDTLKEHNAAVANWRKVEKDIRARQADAAQARAADSGNGAATAGAGSAEPVVAADMPLPIRNPKR